MESNIYRARTLTEVMYSCAEYRSNADDAEVHTSLCFYKKQSMFVLE